MVDLVVSKLRGPVIRPGTVRRSRLIARLARGDRCPIVSVAAAAGYGKTTLLSQWAESNGQPFAWVSVELARVHLALADLPGARTLMREVDDLLSAGPASGPLPQTPGHSGPSCPGNAVPASPGRRR